MQLFYLEHPENEIILSAEESKHATKVLRKKEGDILNFTDGKGGSYKAEITVTDGRKCRLQIVSSEQKEKEHTTIYTLPLPLLKIWIGSSGFWKKLPRLGLMKLPQLFATTLNAK